jgi:hypothetical protein
MHLIASWDIKPRGERRREIDNAMKEGLYGYSWIHPLEMFYIVDLNSHLDWTIIQERFLSIAQNFMDEVNFLMSPVYEEEAGYFVFQIPDGDFYKMS